MKRLMIAAAVICIAAISEAASVKWTATNVYAGNDSVKASGTAYLMLASDVADFGALKGKGASAVNEALAKAIYSYTPASAGTYTLTVSNADLGLNDSTEYGSAYLVVFDTTTVTDASKFYVTSTKGLTTYAGDNTASLAFGPQANSKVAANWSSVAAPEPTSGFLLLLGMAGLALKRKRA